MLCSVLQAYFSRRSAYLHFSPSVAEISANKEGYKVYCMLVMLKEDKKVDYIPCEKGTHRNGMDVIQISKEKDTLYVRLNLLRQFRKTSNHENVKIASKLIKSADLSWFKLINYFMKNFYDKSCILKLNYTQSDEAEKKYDFSDRYYVPVTKHDDLKFFSQRKLSVECRKVI